MCKMTKNKRLIDMRQNAGDSTMVQHADFFLCKATLKKTFTMVYHAPSTYKSAAVVVSDCFRIAERF